MGLAAALRVWAGLSGAKLCPGVWALALWAKLGAPGRAQELAQGQRAELSRSGASSLHRGASVCLGKLAVETALKSLCTWHFLLLAQPSSLGPGWDAYWPFLFEMVVSFSCRACLPVPRDSWLCPGSLPTLCPLQSPSREKGEQEADAEDKGWAVWEGRGSEDPVVLGPATGPLCLMLTLCPKSASFFLNSFFEITIHIPFCSHSETYKSLALVSSQSCCTASSTDMF